MSTIRSKPTVARFIMAAVVLVILAVSSDGHAQPIPIGEQYRNVSPVLSDIGAVSVVYLPVNKEALQLHYIPFFAMKADKNGNLDVVVQNGSTPTTKIISVWMLLSPHNKLEAIAHFLRDQEAIRPIDRRFVDVQASQLVGIPFMNLDVAEADTSRIGFGRVTLNKYTAQGQVQLDATVPAADADKIADDLRKGSRLPTFVVRYDLDARITLSQSQIEADLRYFQETKGVKDLLAAPKTSDKFGWNVGPGGMQFQQPFLTRDQRGTFEGQLKTQVKVLIQLQDDRDVPFLQYMQNYFSKVLQRTTLDINKTSLGYELANMSTYDFDPKDLRPDEIDKLVADVKHFFSSDEKDFLNTEVGAKASFLGFGGSANVKYTKDELRKRMEDKGWKFEANGKFTVPRAFEVHLVDEKALKIEGAYSTIIDRSTRGFMTLNQQVSTKNRYYPESVMDVLVAFEDLRAQVKVRGDELEAMKQSATMDRDNVQGRLASTESKLTKITDGWFLIRSAMVGNVRTYILDVRGFGPDGQPVLQLVGDDNAVPQDNRKFRLQLLDPKLP